MAAGASRVLRAVLATVACLLICIATDASARRFQMSGTWIYRNGGGFIPLQLAAAGMDASGNAIHASMGNLTEALNFPNGPIPGQGGVTATGSAPATLRIPPHRFVEDAMFEQPLLCGITGLVQITTNFGVDAPYDPATLAPGLGPGSFTWCPQDPACLAGGGMRSTDPPQGAGTRKGRVVYRAGANRFGGAMQLGLRRGGSLSTVVRGGPLWRFAHNPIGAPLGATALRRLPEGGLGSADLPSQGIQFLPRAFVTQPTMFTICQLILYPGPKLTTMYGLSTTGTGPIFYLPTVGTGPMGTLAGQYTTRYGFGQTTGTVIAQQSQGTGGQDFFTVMGSDARTPLGAGNLSLVAGGLSFRNTQTQRSPSASFQKVSLTLGAPIPSLSPEGLAAAAALVLLAAGWALRRRSP